MSRVCTVPSCTRTDVRPYVVGDRCPADSPAAQARRPEPATLVDPERTLVGLRVAKGLPVEVIPGRSASAVLEARHKAKGQTASKELRARVRAS